MRKRVTVQAALAPIIFRIVLAITVCVLGAVFIPSKPQFGWTVFIGGIGGLLVSLWMLANRDSPWVHGMDIEETNFGTATDDPVEKGLKFRRLYESGQITFEEYRNEITRIFPNLPPPEAPQPKAAPLSPVEQRRQTEIMEDLLREDFP